MKVSDILARIAARCEEIGTTESQVSAAVASRDLIRNWRRHLAAGKEIEVRAPNLEKIAKVLDVELQWLMYGDDSEQKRAAAPPNNTGGFSDHATEFQGSPSEAAALRSLFLETSKNPCATHECATAMPEFALLPGDLLICDLARKPNAGEVTIVTVHDDESASSQTIVCRYLPPWLSTAPFTSAPLLETDHRVTIRHPVVGIVRKGGVVTQKS